MQHYTTSFECDERRKKCRLEGFVRGTRISWLLSENRQNAKRLARSARAPYSATDAGYDEGR